MNRVFDYNGSLVAPSKPVRTLRTVKKTLHIDSADRDTQKYYTNGDFVVYLPRVYENVVSLRLVSAEFPRIIDETSAGAISHPYSQGQNISTATYTLTPPSPGIEVDAKLDNTVKYFLVDIEGLNKSDETTVSGNRSTFPDSFYAKIPVVLSQNGSSSYFIEYNDHTHGENIARYTPAIGKLDRLHIRTRLHSQQGNQGFIYWTSDGEVPSGTNQKSAEYCLTFEVEYLDNVFDDFSSFETRIGDRSDGFSRQ